MIEDLMKRCFNVVGVMKYVLMMMLDAKIPNLVQVTLEDGRVVHWWAFVFMAFISQSWNVCIHCSIIVVQNCTGWVNTQSSFAFSPSLDKQGYKETSYESS
jgi:hypothetical protein